MGHGPKPQERDSASGRAPADTTAPRIRTRMERRGHKACRARGPGRRERSPFRPRRPARRTRARLRDGDTDGTCMMAIVKVHRIRSTIRKAIEYVENAAKTEGRSLVGTTFGPEDPEWCAKQFDGLQAQAEKNHEGKAGRKGEIKAWHVIQSFAPGETNGAEAFGVGKEFANKLTGGQYDYIVATHVDKGHIHNHILINPVHKTDLTRMQLRFPRDLYRFRDISDSLCRERGLSVIEHPRTEDGRTAWPRTGRPIGQIYAGLGGGSEKKWLAGIIDQAVIRAKDWTDFTYLMKAQGVGVRMRGTQVVFDLPRDGARPVRGASLGSPYMTDELLARIHVSPSPTFVAAASLVGEADGKGMRMVRLPGSRKQFGQDAYIAVSDRQLIAAGKQHVGIIPPGTRLDLFDANGDFLASIRSEDAFAFFARKERRAHIPRPAMAPRGQTKAQQRRNAAIDRKWDTLKLRQAPEARALRERYAALAEDARPRFARELAASIDAKFDALDAKIVERQRVAQEAEGKRIGPATRLRLSRLDRDIAAAEFEVRSLAKAWEDTIGADPKLAKRLETNASGVRFDAQTASVGTLSDVYVGNMKGAAVAAKFEGATDLSKEQAWEIRCSQYMTGSLDLPAELGVGEREAMDALVAVQREAPASQRTKAYHAHAGTRATTRTAPPRTDGRGAPALGQGGRDQRNRQQQQEGPSR